MLFAVPVCESVKQMHIIANTQVTMLNLLLLGEYKPIVISVCCVHYGKSLPIMQNANFKGKRIFIIFSLMQAIMCLFLFNDIVTEW